MSIEVKDLGYTYSPNTPNQKVALQDITFNVQEGETVGIIGSTGSGKSTLIQHLNGLIKISRGKAVVYDVDLSVKKPDYRKVRSMIGMLFQYPEYQLFEDTVLKDVMFAPLNFGKSKQEAEALAQHAIELVGLNFEEIKDKSPFELSGGQKRRVAIAGIIAVEPAILVLDEPTAGLDPVGKREMLQLMTSLKQGNTKIVIMISHNMEEIAEFSDRILVMNDSKLIMDTTPRELFSDRKNLENTGLRLPHCAEIRAMLVDNGWDIPEVPLTATELATAIAKALGGNHA